MALKIYNHKIFHSKLHKINARQYKLLYLNAEPVGFKAPAFSGDAYSQSFIRAVNQSFGLLCQAQAFPVPIIRFVIDIANIG